MCKGISDATGLPIFQDVVVRTTATESQTKKIRIKRRLNMEGRFELVKPQAIEGKHLCLP